ncbi:MAG: metallophosphoesterase family protein [Candidatus Omnitrophota bacterium]|nr:MAG: metallophosphoesterase family protein [Candidatus Omnitrophota bacterium]
MRWAILSDIHGNLEALEAVKAALFKERIDKYLCLGDIVGYGANPRECIAEVRNLGAPTVAGNHDWAAVGLFDITYFNPTAGMAVLWTVQNISEHDKAYLKNLELTYQEDDLTLVHGSLNNPEKFEYILDIPSAKKTFELTQTKLCFIGHSHSPAIFIREGDNYSSTARLKLKLDPKQSYIVNAGSIGQPRDGNPRACFVIYDNETNELEIKRVAYDVGSAQAKIIKAGLPHILAERLATGR